MRMEMSNLTPSSTLNSSSRSNSRTSSNSELEKELKDLEISNNNNNNNTSGNNIKNGILSTSTSSSSSSSKATATTTPTAASTSTTTTTTSSGAATGTTTTTTTVVGNNLTNTKKRISNNSNSRTPTRKAKRIRFYRNGDRFYPGITIPVSYERYRSFESLAEDLTRLLEENVKIPGAVRNIYTLSGKKVSNLDELEDGQSYVCSCNNESFKKIEYYLQQTNTGLTTTNVQYNSNRLSKVHRPSSPLKNGTNGSPTLRLNERDSVHPRIITLIRGGTKPRKVMRLLLNKRNSPNFDNVLSAITQVVKLDSGWVRRVFTLSGTPVLQLSDFFGPDYVFFAYGTERFSLADLKLESDELKLVQQATKRIQFTDSHSKSKPKMPVKSNVQHHNNHSNDIIGELLKTKGVNTEDLPLIIRERYTLENIIGDGNFAIVVKLNDNQNNDKYALKIIDKSKCMGKEHYIDAEVRVMKKLNHPHIISLILDVDTPTTMYLVLEYVGGGDLFDAITRVTKFSEDQSRIMIRHLASAMAYLHSLGIVHRDVKPENLLVKLDDKGNVLELKLADFGLACEVTEPLTAVCGTPTYVAPEILMETGYGLKIDVWAAGIILYILLCGFPPFVSPDHQQEPLFDSILSGVYEFPEPYWTGISEGVRDLISNMLQPDPMIRFSSEDILDHYWTLGETYEYS